MNAQDLDQLAALLEQADRVVPMRDIFKGDIGRRVIGMRHDVDDNPGSLDTALRMAEWEFLHGYSSTYYLLHDAYYWKADTIETMLVAAERLEEYGHEVGIHVNAVAEGLRRQRDPRHILRDALAELRTAVRVEGCVAHGDPWCRNGDGDVIFVNDEMFTESRRPSARCPEQDHPTVGDAAGVVAVLEGRVRVVVRRELAAARQLPVRQRRRVVSEPLQRPPDVRRGTATRSPAS